MTDAGVEASVAQARRLLGQGRLDEAERAVRGCVAVWPAFAPAWELAADVAWRRGDVGASAGALERAAALEPGNPRYLKKLGLAFTTLGRGQDAVRALERAAVAAPGDAELQFHLGNAYQDLGEWARAAEAYGRSIAIRPDVPQSYNNLGAVLRRLGRLAEAAEQFERAVELQPAFPEALHNLGGALHATGRWEEALAATGRALSLRPDYAEARASLGLMLLLHGDFAQGWPAFEARRVAGRRMRKHAFVQPYWDGSPLSGRRLLLCAEQGFGDTIQFVRYVPMIAKSAGGRVIVQCQPELRRLLASQADLGPVVSFDDPLPAFDTYCLMMSVPALLRTTLQTIPNDVPYLRAEASAARRWKERLSADPAPLKVGLVWSGSPTHTDDLNRSLPLAAFSQMAGTAGVSFYSLQLGPAAGQAQGGLGAAMRLTDWTAELSDFADTAALVSGLDLVLTVDTAVAHLAGAMGKPVWVLLPFVPDFRWMLGRADSPWYPTMRLFRQRSQGDWGDPLAQVEAELKALLS